MNDFSIASILGIIRKSIWYLISTALVFAVAAYVYCSFIATPTYQAKASFIATNSGFGAETENASTIKSTDISASLALINTYVDILKTSGIYEEVAADTGLGYSAGQLRSMITVAPRSEETLFIDVRVTSASPEHSVKIANAFITLGSDYVVDKMPNAYIRGIENSSSAVQNYPRTMSSVVLAAFIGCVLVLAIAFLVSMMDKTIKGEKDFSANYDIPVLGSIPNFRVAAREEKK